MDKVLIISKQSGQTEKFIRELPDYLEESGAEFTVDFANYPEYEEKARQSQWRVIGLSPELLVEDREVRKHLQEMGVKSKVASIRGVHFGLRRYDLIFSALFAEEV